MAVGARDVVVETTPGDLAADPVVSCAGLHSDGVARRLGHEPSARIIPFRGEYFELSEAQPTSSGSSSTRCRTPSFPFLGVHLTRGIDGRVHAGPNAVLAFAREGYDWGTVGPRARGTLGYAGFWRLARRHSLDGAAEMARSLGPPVRRERAPAGARGADADLVPAPAGVRAQAVRRDG